MILKKKLDLSGGELFFLKNTGENTLTSEKMKCINSASTTVAGIFHCTVFPEFVEAFFRLLDSL